MISISRITSPSRLIAVCTVLLVGAAITEVAEAAYDLYQTGATGGGQQFAYAASTPVSGTMTALVPKFNGNLGTLLQADFEFASSITGTWIAVGNPGGVSTFNLSGPADVDGQPMGNLAVGFTGPYDNVSGSNDFDANSVFLSLNSGAFFNTLTGPGTVTMSWNYAGSTALSSPATGTGPGGEGFSWGGSVHVLYTYAEVPEPGTCLLGALGSAGLIARARRRRR
jgi:PEP-CTERM motif